MARRDSTTEGSAGAAMAGPSETERRADALNRTFAGQSAEAVLKASIGTLFAGRLAVVSSFGTESAVLLHLVASIDPTIPVLFVDTDKLFGETLRYRKSLVQRLKLTDARILTPDPSRLAALDPKGGLWARDTDLCCRIRKVEPLALALAGTPDIAGFDAWISGRKRFQSATRFNIPLFEAEGERIKVNPLADWGPKELQAYADLHELPPHPLIAQGYPSIGCMPCTDPVAPGEDARAGRWRGQDKTECGIHVGDLIVTEEDAGSGI